MYSYLTVGCVVWAKDSYHKVYTYLSLFIFEHCMPHFQTLCTIMMITLPLCKHYECLTRDLILATS